MNRRLFIRSMLGAAATMALAKQAVAAPNNRPVLEVEYFDELHDWGTAAAITAAAVFPDGEQYRFGVSYRIGRPGIASKARAARLRRMALDRLDQQVKAHYARLVGGPMPILRLRRA